MLFLSKETLYIWHQCRTRAFKTVQRSQRFSLISQSDYQATVASEAVRNLHRRSVPSEQIFGFHVVCGECDGFVVRNGVVQNCRHQRDSSSTMSKESEKRRQEAAGTAMGPATNAVRINIQPPSPESNPELGTREKFPRSAGLHPRNTAVGGERQSAKPRVPEPVPAILRPGYVPVDEGGARTIERPGEAVRPHTPVTSRHPRRDSATAKIDAEMILHGGDAAGESRLLLQGTSRANYDSDGSENTDQPLCNPDVLMQNWREWSERWERLVAQPNSDVDKSGSISQSHCDSETVMQDWRAWSERWERLVISS